MIERDPSPPEPRVPRGDGCCEDEERRGSSSVYEQPVNGVYRAGSDHRKDGHAGGW